MSYVVVEGIEGRKRSCNASFTRERPKNARFNSSVVRIVLNKSCLE